MENTNYLADKQIIQARSSETSRLYREQFYIFIRSA